MRRAIGWCLVVAVAFAALFAVPQPAQSADRLAPGFGKAKIPFRHNRAALVGGFEDVFEVDIADGGADTTAPIVIGRGVSFVGSTRITVGNEVPIKFWIITTEDFPAAHFVTVEYSVDGVRWQGDGVIGVAFVGDGKSGNLPLIQTRTSAMGAGSLPGENATFFPYIRLIIAPDTGQSFTGLKLFVTYFKTESR